MKTTLIILDFLAISLQFAGAIAMFNYSPINTPKFPTQMGGITDTVTYKIKNRGLKNGFLVLMIGFGIQLLSMIMKLFF